MSTWKILRCPAPMQGHKFFREKESYRIAIADWSGSTPEKTDDGVLWLDATRPIVVSFSSSRRLVTWLPLQRPDGRETHAPTDLQTALFAVGLAGMKVELAHPELKDLVRLLKSAYETPHHPDCPATDGFGCRCDELGFWGPDQQATKSEEM